MHCRTRRVSRATRPDAFVHLQAGMLALGIGAGSSASGGAVQGVRPRSNAFLSRLGVDGAES